MDFTKMIAKTTNHINENVIDNDNMLTMTQYNLDLPEYEHHYQRRIAKSVNDNYGISFYGHDGDLLNYMSSEDLGGGFNDFFVEQDVIEYYGTSTEFDLDIETLKSLFDSIGYETTIDSNAYELYAINDSIELYVNYDLLMIETKYFTDDEPYYKEVKFYQEIDDYIIPIRFVNITYDILFSGIDFQRAEITDYTSYIVINENGDSLVSFISESELRSTNPDEIQIHEYQIDEKKNMDVKVYPNPANNNITVEMPFSLSNNITLQIVNSFGKLVYTKENIESIDTLNIDISNFAIGIYIIRVGSYGDWKTTKLIVN